MELRPLIHVTSVHLDRCQEYAYVIGELVITSERKGCHETRAEPDRIPPLLAPASADDFRAPKLRTFDPDGLNILRTRLNNSTFCVCAPLEDSTVTRETNQ
jgi:hypothetical protein